MVGGKREFHPILRGLIGMAGLFALSSVVQAQNIDWTGSAGNGLWDTASNWAGSNIPNNASEAAEFDSGSFATPGDQTITLSSDREINYIALRTSDNLTFNGSATLTVNFAAMYRFSGSGNTIVFNPNLSRLSGTGIGFTNLTNSQVTINGTVHATVDNPSNSGISHSSPGTQITFNNTLSGNGRFYMSNGVGDSGGATFTAANTYQGATSVTSGILTVTGNGTLGDGTGFIGIFGPSTLQSTDAVLELNNLNTPTISNAYILGGDGQSGGGVLRLTGGSANFTGLGSTTGNGGSLTKIVTSSGTTLTISNRLRGYNNNTIEFAAEGDVETSGAGFITQSSGGANVTKSGGGTLTFGGAENTHAGVTTIDGGALVLNSTGNSIADGGLVLNSGTSASLSKSDQIGSSILTLNSATFNTNGFDEALGALVLQGTSNFDLGSGDSVIAFADSSAQSWTAGQTFLLLNWSGSISGGGTDQVLFGSDASGLTSGQLSQVIFRNPDGFGAGDYAAQILGTGEVVPVPEASTYALVLGIVAGVYLIYRRRKQAAA